MKRGLIVLGSMVLIIFLVYLLLDKNENDWRLTYKIKSKEPYGVKMFYDLMLKQSPAKPIVIEDDFITPIQKALNDSNTRYTYIGFSYYPYLNKQELKMLIEFVEKGNDVFLIANSITDTFLTILTGANNTSEYLSNFSTSNDVCYKFLHPNFKNDSTFCYQHYYKKKGKGRYLNYFNLYNDYYPSKSFITISTFANDETRGICLQHKTKKGGTLLFHLDPMVFTNYYMRTPSGLNYVNQVLSHVKPNALIWDMGNHRKGENQSFISQGKSPIDFIMERRELKTAWYVLLILGLCFLIFGTKRMQKPIPVITYRKNTSLGFVETIGALYLSKNAHKDIARMKMEHFLWYLRNKLGVNTTRISPETFKTIERKTGVPELITERVFSHYEKRIKNNTALTADDVVILNAKIYSFYKNINDEQRRNTK